MKHRSVGIRVQDLVALLLAALPAKAAALVSIECKSWHGSCGELQCRFEARSTASDAAGGVRFTLLERGGDGNRQLMEVALPWAPPFPPPGSEIRGFVRMKLDRTVEGLSGQYIVDWHITWCEPGGPTQVRRAGLTQPLATGTCDPEAAFECALADENGVEGTNPTADEFLVCNAAEAQLLREWLSPFEMVSRGLAVTDPSYRPPDINAFIPASDPAQNGSVGLYFSPDGTSLCANATQDQPIDFYVLAKLAGVTECGITGVEYRVSSLPDGWFVAGFPPDEAIMFGNPLGDVGCNVAFHNCTNDSPVLLFSGTLYPTSAVADYSLQVGKRNPSTNPNFACLLVTLCDSPSYTIACVGPGAPAILNPLPGATCGTTAANQTTWSRVKQLYR